MTKEKPNGNLFSYDIVISISMQCLIVFVFQFSCFKMLKNQTWYVENPVSETPLFDNPNYENTVNFLFKFFLNWKLNINSKNF